MFGTTKNERESLIREAHDHREFSIQQASE
jgi:hypothetical protein